MRTDSGSRLSTAHAFLMSMLCIGFVVLAHAQDAPATNTQPQDGLEELVGRIALYPDDLLSIILPASTFPLQIVEAERWLKQNAGKADAEPKASWDDSVKALINYPEVVTMMSEDLEWTSAMGEAVASDQTGVMDAVQSFRRKAAGAGNLASDDRQVVVVEKEVVKIVQADPQVIYVPQYEPQIVVVQQPAPVYPTYYPTPYPVYYYPYPPGHAFAAGVFWGATLAYAFDWHGGSIHNDIDIDIDRNINVTNVKNRATNIDSTRSQQMAQERKASWQSQQNPADVRQGRAPTASQQGGNRGAGGAQATNRSAATAQAQRAPAQTGAGRQPGTSPTAANRNYAASANYSGAARSASSARTQPPTRDAFSGMSDGRSVTAQSSRGAVSRSGGVRRR